MGIFVFLEMLCEAFPRYLSMLIYSSHFHFSTRLRLQHLGYITCSALGQTLISLIAIIKTELKGEIKCFK